MAAHRSLHAKHKKAKAIGHHHVNASAVARAIGLPKGAMSGRAQIGVQRHNAAGVTQYK